MSTLSLRKFQAIILGSYLILCPIAFNMEMFDTRLFQTHFWQIMVMLFVVTYSRNIYLIAFFFWNIILMATNNFEVGHVATSNIFMGILMYTCSKAWFSKNKISDIKWQMMVVSALTCLFMITQILDIDPIHFPVIGNDVDLRSNADLIGLFGLKAHNGIFLAIAMQFACFFNPIVAALFIYPIWLSESTGAVISALFGFAFYLFYRYQVRLKSIVFLVSCLSLIITATIYISLDVIRSHDMANSRFGLWHMVAKFSLARPLGYGPGSFVSKTPNKDFMFFGDQNHRPAIGYFDHVNEETGRDVYAFKYYDPNFTKMHKEEKTQFLERPNRWSNAHNLFIQVWFEYGIVGVVLMLSMLKDMFFRFKNAIKTKELIIVSSCILVFLTSSMTQFPLYVAKLGYLFPILLGCFYSITERRS